jgi:hypothetical protein
MRVTRLSVLIALVAVALSAAAQDPQAPQQPSPQQPVSFDQVMDRVMDREAQFVNTMRNYTPIVETYIQNMQPDKELGAVPKSDEYFLGRLRFDGHVDQKSFLNDRPGFYKRLTSKLTGFMRVEFLPLGFAQMIMVDGQSFDRAHYDFKFVRREFIGEIRTIVVDVTPKPKSGEGRFLGRIWVEDQDYNIVRFNGTYSPQTKKGIYLHFDSWRLNMAPGLWLPAYIYSEESNMHVNMFHDLQYKSQTRLWGYNVKDNNNQQEFSQILVDNNDAVKDQSQNVQDLAPVASQRAWERQAEENVLERLQRASLLATPGEVDKVLETVINNLEITNNITVEPEIRCRVLLTAPMETFTIGHTIVVSRGLLDVLPDEATLAVILSHEMAHIVLGHRLDTKYAFNDRMLFNDSDTFRRFDFERNPADEAAADKKAIEILQKSPYKDKLANAGLFLRQLDERRKELPALVRAHLGNPLVDKGQELRLHELLMSSPALAPTDVKQIAALPLGGRIKMDPFNNKLEISKNKPVSLLSAREKMPFEVTPMFPYLTRLPNPTMKAATTTGGQ